MGGPITRQELNRLKIRFQEHEEALKLGGEVDLTIASGNVYATKGYHSLVVEGGTGSGVDDLDTADGGTAGMILVLKAKTSGGSDTVTVKNGTGVGAFILAGGLDFDMDHVDDTLVVIHNGTEWVELTRSDNS